MTTPATPGTRMPAEWEPHERCLMAWPVRADLWGDHLAAARGAYAEVADAIAAFEPVTMVAAPGTVDSARAALPGSIEVIELPIDDSWLRDSGPIGVVSTAPDGRRRRAGIDFVFNSWGEKFAPFDQDALVAERLLEHLGIERIESPMVLEGGSITVDGEGTLITTEQCLLDPNRNPSMSRNDIEAELGRTLGVDKVVWLPWGAAEDWHTDGHVDIVASFVRPGTVLAQSCPDPANPNHERMAANLRVLREAVDARGRSFEVVEIPHIPYFEVDGASADEVFRTSYLNFYVANGGVIVPTSGGPEHDDIDADAVATIAAAFPEREVVGVPSRWVFFGGGGIHCITQQLPAL